MAFYDEDDADSKTNGQADHRPIQPPTNLGIAQRYDVFWTHVSGKAIVATHKVTLDIDPHLMVLDVTDLTDLVSPLVACSAADDEASTLL